MNWIDKLEKKFGRYAISNLMYYVIILYALGYVISVVAPDFYTGYLSLDPTAIMRGQIWRIVTFIIYPPSSTVFLSDQHVPVLFHRKGTGDAVGSLPV